MSTATNTSESGKIINMKERELTYMPTEINTLGNGKKMNTMLQIINVSAMDRVFIHMPTELSMLENGKKVYGMEKESLPMLMEKLKKEFGKKIN